MKFSSSKEIQSFSALTIRRSEIFGTHLARLGANKKFRRQCVRVWLVPVHPHQLRLLFRLSFYCRAFTATDCSRLHCVCLHENCARLTWRIRWSDSIADFIWPKNLWTHQIGDLCNCYDKWNGRSRLAFYFGSLNCFMDDVCTQPSISGITIHENGARLQTSKWPGSMNKVNPLKLRVSNENNT